MSLIITIYLNDAIVMASDSRTTLTTSTIGQNGSMIINSFPLCDTMFLDNLTKFDHKLFSCIVIVLLHSSNFSAKLITIG